MSPLEAGLATLPATIGLVVSAPFVPRWAAKFGTRQIVALGFAITAGGFVALMAIKSSWEYGVFVIPFLAVAVGMSMSNGPCSSVSTSAVPVEQVGAASGISNMARYVGAAVMTSVAAAVYGSVTADRLDAGKAPGDALAAGFSRVALGDGHHLGTRHPLGIDDGPSSLDQAGHDRRLRRRSRLEQPHDASTRSHAHTRRLATVRASSSRRARKGRRALAVACRIHESHSVRLEITRRAELAIRALAMLGQSTAHVKARSWPRGWGPRSRSYLKCSVRWSAQVGCNPIPVRPAGTAAGFRWAR